jgi:hypothetical protein
MVIGDLHFEPLRCGKVTNRRAFFERTTRPLPLIILGAMLLLIYTHGKQAFWAMGNIRAPT